MIQVSMSLILEILGISLSIAAIFLGLGPLRKHIVDRSKLEFQGIRKYISEERPLLTERAFEFYANRYGFEKLRIELNGMEQKIHVLCPSEWIPEKPINLKNVRIVLVDSTEHNKELPSFPNRYLPFQQRRLLSRFSTYSDAIYQLDRPYLFVNKDIYRLLGIKIGNEDATFEFDSQRRNFFDHIDSESVVSYELGRFLERYPNLPNERLFKKLNYRGKLGNPLDFVLRKASLGIDTLTLYKEQGRWKYLLLLRNEKVAEGGGYFHVVPSGEFQPAVWGRTAFDDEIINRDRDFWRNIMREYDEEIQNSPEIDYYGEYLHIPPYEQLMSAYEKGEIKVYLLGACIDPFNLRTQMLTACVFKENTFHKIFTNLKELDAEGKLTWKGNSFEGLEFSEDEIKKRISSQRTLEPAKALLALAWKNKEFLEN